ncbi:GH92 family glycosyl hydrolase [Marinilabilia rubra]|uniref:Alpha-mannosidase n=1 Tax=Marinilabilia rubra TaxID=2162893 RepID=A0A2U2B497_9BACT|nr:GH92 family glycosyl hydrolase [Marinilabilia rubra]PWD97864.1 alpha-mannosidase [Marinilabilia rubra]
MILKINVISILLGIALFTAGCTKEKKSEPVDYVNPYMGNISHLLVPTYPTIHLTNSFLRVYPQRHDYTGDLLHGLPVVVTSHRGSSAFNLSPVAGIPDNFRSVYDYSYDLEEITPYDYSVFLDEQGIDIKMAVSHQSALYQISFPKKESASLVVNTANGSLKWDGKAITGFQQLQNNTRVFIYLEPEIKPQNVTLPDGEGLITRETKLTGENVAMVMHFNNLWNPLNIRYGISFIDASQASRNVKREIADFDIDKLRTKGRKTWNKALGKLKIKGGTLDQKSVFYTSLYRTYERPVCISEDGRYFSAFDGEVHSDKGVPFYTDDWIWDTYRATHPLRVLIEPEMEEDIIRSFLRMAEQMDHFWMPTFPEITGDSRRMNSNHGVATVIDAYRKGLTGFDLKKAYQACKNAITEKTLAPWSAKPAGELDRFYQEHGYIPALKDDEEEYIPEVHSFERRQPVAVTLGTAYDEWCLAQIAQELNYREQYMHFIDRALNYRHLFHPQTHFFHPRDSAGLFIEPFDYVFSGGQGARQYYGENNAWVYRWDVPHNVKDLIDMMGGPEAFDENLDSMFAAPLGKSKYSFYAQLPDHTGNVGQFSMANEPSLHIPYLYNYAGTPWKTQKRIRNLLNQWFRNDLMGVPGDEDGGGMSAFVVFSQLGFYPVSPGLPVYNIGSPVFAESEVKLGNGHTFRVETENYDPDHKFIQSATLNGESWEKPWFSHEELMQGGILKLTMGKYPNKYWGARRTYAPPSFKWNETP